VFPLDGSRLLAAVLPDRWRRRYESHAPYAVYVLLFALSLGGLSATVADPNRAALDASNWIGLRR
jgi:Zn-dependent protease